MSGGSGGLGASCMRTPRRGGRGGANLCPAPALCQAPAGWRFSRLLDPSASRLPPPPDSAVLWLLLSPGSCSRQLRGDMAPAHALLNLHGAPLPPAACCDDSSFAAVWFPMMIVASEPLPPGSCLRPLLSPALRPSSPLAAETPQALSSMAAPLPCGSLAFWLLPPCSLGRLLIPPHPASRSRWLPNPHTLCRPSPAVPWLLPTRAPPVASAGGCLSPALGSSAS